MNRLILLFLLLTNFVWAQTVTEAPDYNEVFHRYQGWTGADGTYSVPLSDGTTLWLFSDTFVGHVSADERRLGGWAFLHNSVVRQRGDSWDFGGEFGPAHTLFEPPDGQGWLWLLDGHEVAPGLVEVYLVQFVGQGGMDFRCIGSWKARLRVDPEPEVIGYEKIRHFRRDRRGALAFGASVMHYGPWVYLYGTLDRGVSRQLFLARYPRGEGQEKWQFFGRQGWTANLDEARPLVDDVSNELSVHADGAGFVLIYQLLDRIYMRRAGRPEGPFGAPTEIWKTPEASDTVFSYNAKAHPEIFEPGKGFLVSYNVNGSQELVLRRGDIYRPRFIWVRLNE